MQSSLNQNGKRTFEASLDVVNNQSETTTWDNEQLPQPAKTWDCVETSEIVVAEPSPDDIESVISDDLEFNLTDEEASRPDDAWCCIPFSQLVMSNILRQGTDKITPEDEDDDDDQGWDAESRCSFLLMQLALAKDNCSMLEQMLTSGTLEDEFLVEMSECVEAFWRQWWQVRKVWGDAEPSSRREMLQAQSEMVEVENEVTEMFTGSLYASLQDESEDEEENEDDEDSKPSKPSKQVRFSWANQRPSLQVWDLLSASPSEAQFVTLNDLPDPNEEEGPAFQIWDDAHNEESEQASSEEDLQ